MKKFGFFLLLITLFFFTCKKKEERDLVSYFEGDYIGMHSQMSCCDDSGHTIVVTEPVELEVKRSSKGVRIEGIEVFENFDVNYKDSTFSAEFKKSQENASGRFFSNDSITIWMSLSPKLPNGHLYNVKRK